jgi:hypothetical protein
MIDNALQHLMQDDARIDQKSTPDFRFTNYAFARQQLSEQPLPQIVNCPEGLRSRHTSMRPGRYG